MQCELVDSACIEVACYMHASTYILLVRGRDVAQWSTSVDSF